MAVLGADLVGCELWAPGTGDGLCVCPRAPGKKTHYSCATGDRRAPRRHRALSDKKGGGGHRPRGQGDCRGYRASPLGDNVGATLVR